MTGEPVNPNSIPHSPLQEQITDPALRENIALFDGVVDKFMATTELSLDLVESLQSFNDRINVIVTPEGEVTRDSDLIDASALLAGMAWTTIEGIPTGVEALLDLPTVIDTAASSERQALNVRFRQSQLVSFTAAMGIANDASFNLGIPKKQRIEASRFKSGQQAVNAALEESRQPGPALTTKEALGLLEPIQVVNEIVQASQDVQDPVFGELNAQMIKFYRNLPSMSTVEHLGFRAYVATIRTLREYQADDSVGLFTPEARQTLKHIYGFSDEHILAHEAARILALAKQPLVPGLSDDYGPGAYEMPLFKIFNIMPTKEQAVPSIQADIISNAPWIPKEKQPAIAAQEIMYELIRKIRSTESWHNIVGTTVRLVDEGLHKIVRPMYAKNEKGFAEAATAAHQMLVEDLADSMDPERLRQALLIEDYMNSRLAEVTARLRETPLAEIDPAGLEFSIQPLIREHIEKNEEAVQLEEIEDFCDASRQEIAKLDEPYNYTSKRIRSYENGPVTLSSLKQALDKRDVLVDEDARRTLAIMMLQSEQADDPVAYFEELRDTRDLIELYLSDMTYLGQKGQANVTNVLRWVDEMINAGLENSVDHARLKQFIQNYYLGIEEATETEAESAEPPEPKKNSKKDYNRAAQEYVDYYAEVLEGVDVEYSDVTFFTKKSRDTTRRVSEGRIRSPGEAPVNVDKNRLAGLVKLKREFESDGKSARLIITEPTRSKRIPYMALYVQEHLGDSTGVCFMENVEVNTATYCLTVDGNYVRDWDELADYTLKEWSEEWGAKSYVHPVQDTPYFAHHYTLMLKKHAITELAKLRQHQ